MELLKQLIKVKPECFFEKGQIKAPKGQIYFCSAYQLMIFLCDSDMKVQIMPLIPEEFNEKRDAQYAELGCGGADLIKLGRNPLEIFKESGFKFNVAIIRGNFLDGTPLKITFRLLENQNGIFYYQDVANNEVHFYYANKKTQELHRLDIHPTSKEDQQAFEQFKASFIDMENNSGRRSSDQEHELITKLMNRTLVREGIPYEHNGIRYRDSRTPFNLINAYRKCIKLYMDASDVDEWNFAHYYWQKVVGMAQGEEIWLLQKSCNKDESFPIYNGETLGDIKEGAVAWQRGSRNLLAISRLIEDAKVNIIDLDLERERKPIVNG